MIREKKASRWVISLVIVILLLTGQLSFVATIQAVEYPVKPISFIVLAEAGSGSDIMLRSVAQKASAILGKPIIVVNKPGAGGSIGLKEIHDAKPDGYTIGGTLAVIVSNKLQGLSNVDYRDFSVICTNHVSYPALIAATKTKQPFKTVEEAISFARVHPKEVSMATSGVGYIWWIATMALEDKAGVKFNVIPQPGTTAFITTQVAGEHTDLGTSTLSVAKSQIDAGNVRFLAMFGPKRAPEYPDVPTLKEATGYDIPIAAGGFIIGPQKMPVEIIDKLAKAWELAVADPEFQKLCEVNNSLPNFLPPDKAIKYLDEQRVIYRSVMGKAGILKEK